MQRHGYASFAAVPVRLGLAVAGANQGELIGRHTGIGLAVADLQAEHARLLALRRVVRDASHATTLGRLHGARIGLGRKRPLPRRGDCRPFLTLQLTLQPAIEVRDYAQTSAGLDGVVRPAKPDAGNRGSSRFQLPGGGRGLRARLPFATGRVFSGPRRCNRRGRRPSRSRGGRGVTTGTGFVAQARATARAARGLPMAPAISE